MPTSRYSQYDQILLKIAATLRISPSLLRHINLGLLIVAAIGLGIALTQFFNRLARKYRDRWGEILFSVLAILPVPVLLIVTAYIDVDVLSLTFHSAHIELMQRSATTLAVAVAYYIPTRVGLLFLRRWGQRRAGREKTTRLLAFLIEAAVVLIAIYTLLESLRLAPRHEHFSARLLMTLAVFLGCYGAGRMVTLYLSRMSQEDPSVARFTEPAAFAARAVFAMLAVMIVLENMGVHLTAVWTTLGVGSVAVAMALQETLSNFFAGLYLLADRPISAGEYVKLDSGQEGYILRVGWRSTSIRSLAKNLIVVPNATLAKAVLTNYSHPHTQMMLPILVGVAYGTNPRRASQVLKEIAEEAIRDGLAGLKLDSEPLVRFMPGFGDSSLDFTLMVEVLEFADQFSVQSELRMRIVERFDREEIEFPFPTRNLVFDKSTQEMLGLLAREPQPAHYVPANGTKTVAVRPMD